MNNEDWEVCCSSIDESDEQMISSIDQQQISDVDVTDEMMW